MAEIKPRKLPPEHLHWIAMRAAVEDEAPELGRIDREELLGHIAALNAELLALGSATEASSEDGIR